MKLLLLLLPLVACDLFTDTDPAIRSTLVDEINAMKTTWTASVDQGPFFGSHFTLGQAKRLMGVRSGPLLPQKEEYTGEAVPASFDSSTHWPSCPTIMEIRDQSACGSCWAVGGAEAMSDRYCTMLGTKYANVRLSAGELLSCCGSCGMGCGGGMLGAAWSYWVRDGLADTKCMPYPFPKCEHHIPAGRYPVCPKNEYPTPKCNHTCTDGSAPTKYHGTRSYGVTGEEKLMEEIYKNGPVEVAFTVYEDFLSYKSGVYKHVSGSALGGHAVKMIGWGVTSDGTKYWIINNSWNADWGNHGQFWILRGVDECGIESQGTAGDPKAF